MIYFGLSIYHKLWILFSIMLPTPLTHIGSPPVVDHWIHNPTQQLSQLVNLVHSPISPGPLDHPFTTTLSFLNKIHYWQTWCHYSYTEEQVSTP